MFSILIVTHNSEDCIDSCLQACQSLSPSEILVIDNASQDQTLRRLSAAKFIRVIANRTNLGFAGAINQGLRILRTPLVLILNPDTQPRNVAPLIDAFADLTVGAASGRLFSPQGVPQDEFHLRRFPTPATLIFEALGLNRLWPSNPVNRRYRSPAQEGFIDQPAGAFLMIRRSAWEHIGGFDERFYPVWFEDVDFCRRLKQAGWRIAFCPAAAALHSGGASIRKLNREAREVFWYGNLLRYVHKHAAAATFRLTCATVALAAFLRCVCSALQLEGGAVKGYSKVIYAALAGTFSGRIGSAVSGASVESPNHGGASATAV